VLTTITDLTLFEVSVCTFPAYESTEVEARAKEAHANAIKAWRESMRTRLTGGENTVKEINENA
jgi:phage head maturation protease